MRGKREESWLAALALCTGCWSSTWSGTGTEATTTGDTSTSTSSSTTGSDGTGGSGGAKADSTGSGAGAANGTDGSSSTTATGTGTAMGAGAGTGGADATSSGATLTGTSGQVASLGNATLACLEYVLGFCEQTARCSGGLDGVIPCFEQNRESCPDLLFAPGSARTVDDSFECADAWRALACDIIRPECATAGTLADGEACVSGIQCASRRCSGTPDTCGTCTPSVKQGETCNDVAGPVCESGLACHATDLVCVIPTVATVGGQQLGEACNPAESGCYPNGCLADDAGVYHCEPYPVLGEDCSATATCAHGNSYCDSTLVCAALPVAGEPCGIDFDYVARWCADGLACDANMDPPRCVGGATTPGIGESCTGLCEAGLTCSCHDDACSNRTCLWARFSGESCSSPDETCLMGDCVDGTCVVTEVESTFADLCGE